jgi:hypothetical protein
MRTACLEFLDALERYSDLLEADRGGIKLLPTGELAPECREVEVRRQEASDDYAATASYIRER